MVSIIPVAEKRIIVSSHRKTVTYSHSGLDAGLFAVVGESRHDAPDPPTIDVILNEVKDLL